MINNLSDTVIIVPVFKSKKQLQKVVNRILAIDPKLILLVDDCCPDNSTDIVNKNLSDKIKIIKLNKNRGVGGAFLAGFDYLLAENFKCKFIAKIDSDDQHNPNDLKVFSRIIDIHDCDHVKGNRFMIQKIPKSMGFIRILGTTLLNFFFKLSSGEWNIGDPLNGMFMTRFKVFAEVKKNIISERYLFESELLFSLSSINSKIIDAPNEIAYFKQNDQLNWKKEFFNFFKKYFKEFFIRIYRQYIFPDLNIGILPILTLILFSALSLKKISFILENKFSNMVNDTGDIILFAIYFFSAFFSLFVWLILDYLKNNNKKAIYHFFE
jgi:glycosyltransferase involved in cell wall biosynthesis